MRKIQKIHGQINEPLHTNKDLKIFRGRLTKKKAPASIWLGPISCICLPS